MTGHVYEVLHDGGRVAVVTAHPMVLASEPPAVQVEITDPLELPAVAARARTCVLALDGHTLAVAPKAWIEAARFRMGVADGGHVG